MKALDSDILIAFLRNDEDAVKKLEELEKSGERLTTTVFNQQEILFGASLVGKKALKPALELLEAFEILSYNSEDVTKTVKIMTHLRRKGQVIGAIDEMIAGICLNRGAALVTRNVEHFSKVPGLKIEKW